VSFSPPLPLAPFEPESSDYPPPQADNTSAVATETMSATAVRPGVRRM